MLRQPPYDFDPLRILEIDRNTALAPDSVAHALAGSGYLPPPGQGEGLDHQSKDGTMLPDSHLHGLASEGLWSLGRSQVRAIYPFWLERGIRSAAQAATRCEREKIRGIALNRCHTRQPV
jgi:hypothetical protein